MVRTMTSGKGLGIRAVVTASLTDADERNGIPFKLSPLPSLQPSLFQFEYVTFWPDIVGHKHIVA